MIEKKNATKPLFLFKYKTFNQPHSERVKKIQLLTRKLDIRNMTNQINIVLYITIIISRYITLFSSTFKENVAEQEKNQ